MLYDPLLLVMAKFDQNPDPHWFVFLDPDPHREKLDPDAR
jgi:hypothetical protein